MITSYYSFPYCDYPYTYRDKFIYYSYNTTCWVMKSIGLGFYSRFVFGKNHHRHLNYKNASLTKINNIIKHHKKKIINNIKYGTIFGIVTFPIIGFLSYKNYIDNQNINRFIYAVIVVESCYGYNILAHFYNNIRLCISREIINHGIKIKKFVSKINQNYQFDDNMIQNIYENINKQKLSWILVQSPDNKYYAAYNSYYNNILFVFHDENIIQEFIVKLNTLNINDIDNLSNNPQQIDKLKNDFVQDRMYISIMGCYKSIYNDNSKN
ncbi:hypothetical protein mvi_524 [Megavirus vitis]|nr:hypothetical protein mvi_524 [Megavirus vitis]